MTASAAEPRPPFASRLVDAILWNLAVPTYLLLASIAAVSWYAGAKLAWGDDATHPLSLERIATYYRLLDPGLGGPDGRKFPFLLPLGGILELWRLLNLPYDLTVIQPVVIVLLLSATATSMYALVRYVLPSVPRLGAFGAGLFYTFNLYTTVTIWSSMAYLAVQYAFLPLVIIGWLYALRRRTLAAAIAAALLWAVLLTPAYITTPVAVTDSLLFLAIGLAVVAASTGSRALTFLTGVELYGVWLCVSTFWLIPLVSSTSAVSASGHAVGDPLQLFRQNSAPLLDAVRLGGYWGITATYLEHPYYAWAGYYRSIGLNASTVVPVLALLGVLAWTRGHRIVRRLPTPERRALYFSLGLVLVGLFLITGTHAPLGGLKGTVVSTLHLSGPFRSVYQRFGSYVTLGYAPLIAAGIGALQLAAARVARWRMGGWLVAVAAVAAAAVVPSWPMWRGTIMDSSGVAPARRITVPPSYRQVARLIDDTPGDFDVLTFPFGGVGAMPLHWDETNAGFYDRGTSRGYSGIEPFDLLTGKGVLTADGTAPYTFGWAKDIVKNHDRKRALELLNTRYIVLHLDENIPYVTGAGSWTGTAIRKLAGRLDKLHTLPLVYASNTLRVYAVVTWRPFRVFAAKTSKRGRRISLAHIRPLRYTEHGLSEFVLDTRQLHRGELLVVNRPFDSRWRAAGIAPLDIAPGLTAFRPPLRKNVVVSFPPEARTRRALLLLPCTLAFFCLLLVGLTARDRRRRRRRTGAAHDLSAA